MILKLARKCDELLLKICGHKLSGYICKAANIRTCTWTNPNEHATNDLIIICVFGVVSYYATARFMLEYQRKRFLTKIRLYS